LLRFALWPRSLLKFKKFHFLPYVKQKRNVRIKKEFVEFKRVWFIIPFVYEINKVYFILVKVCNICTYTKNNVYMILRKYLNE